MTLIACSPAKRPPLPWTTTFETLKVSDSADLWFARAAHDFDGDGLQDVVLINHNGYGGDLRLLSGSADPFWDVTIVAGTAPNGGVFSCGDILTADMDGDGAADILAPQNNGEWTSLPKEHTFYWYSWPEPEANFIGTVPDYIKDVEVADFNRDGRTDLAGMSFDGEFVCVFLQGEDGSWEQSLLESYPGLHEGMAVGDVNGDGWMDIAANGYLLYNPGEEGGEWPVSVIDPIWHNQEGDWSRNATKHACADMDGDGRDEVLISHSERSGYPVAMYKATAGDGEAWEKQILLDSLAAAHTLQVADFDLDGDLDVLTGMNLGRAWNLGFRSFPVYILENQGDGTWEPQLIDSLGIYNGIIADFEGDGDMDIFRLRSHDGKEFELLLNQSR
jgi:hypothetical protein